MLVSQQAFPPAFSFEFFPPKTEAGQGKLISVARQFAALEPCYFSVTYGAGGTDQGRTAETVALLQAQTGRPVCPHLTCIGSSRASVRQLLDAYREQGIQHVVALRGDLPDGVENDGDFHYAVDLVAFIRETYGDAFFIEVAAYPEAHPQSVSATDDFDHFCAKVRAGADAALTQYFYNPDAYAWFVERCDKAGLDLPIVPGIMPIVGREQLLRFSTFCGAEIPKWVRQQLDACGEDEAAVARFGHEVTVRLCERLLEMGAPGLHFYSLNRADASMKVWQDLGLSPMRAVRQSVRGADLLHTV